MSAIVGPVEWGSVAGFVFFYWAVTWKWGKDTAPFRAFAYGAAMMFFLGAAVSVAQEGRLFEVGICGALAAKVYLHFLALYADYCEERAANERAVEMVRRAAQRDAEGVERHGVVAVARAVLELQRSRERAETTFFRRGEGASEER